VIPVTAAPAIAAPRAEKALAPRRPPGAALAALVAAVGLATVAAAALAGPLLALVPVTLAAAAYALAKAPLRWSAAAFLFLLLGVDDTSEVVGQWRTPLSILGNLVHNRLDHVTPLHGVSVTGMEVLCAALLLAWAQRRATGRDRSEVRDRVSAAAPLRALALVALAAIGLSMAWGVLHGASWAPWKVRNLTHPFLLFAVFDAAFRGPADHRLVGRVVVASAVARALLAVVVQRLAVLETGGKFLAATSHGDSVLFVVAIFLVLSELVTRDGRRVVRAALLLPILLVGMRENERRVAWIMLALALGVAWAVAPMRGLKRRFTRAAVVATPLLALYVGVGWDRGGRLFAPIQTLRGVSDTSYDHSAYWREVENWNIAVSMRAGPVLGVGLGGEYTERMKNDDISKDYPEYRQWPHNTFLGLLLLLGFVGFTAAWSPFAGALFLALRSHRLARDPEHRTAALACVATIVACHVLAYGDTGAHYPQYKVFMALALTFAGKLAVVTGAWPTRPAAVPPAVLEPDT